MNFYLNVAVVVFWLLYTVMIKMTKKRKYDYSGIFAFVFLISSGYILYFKYDQQDWYQFYVLGILAFFILWIIIDNIVLLFGKNISGDEFKKLKNKLKDVNEESERLRVRFISTIELSFEGIMFKENEHIFCTDKCVSYLGLNDNVISIEDYKKLIHKDDLHEFEKQVEKLSKRQPTVLLKYRMKKSGIYVWIEEKIKLIIFDNERTYISTLKPIDIRQYPTTDVDVLNTIQSDKYMREEMQRLSRSNSPYYLVIINLTNVSVINKKFGRDFGDLMIGEYLSKLRFKFIKDSKSLYRISGVKFGLIVKDKNKFEILKRALVGQGELFSMNMKFGGVNQMIVPNIGISEAPYGGKNTDLVIDEAEKALSKTFVENYGKSYCFYTEKN